MDKLVLIHMDPKIARRMLCVAGFNYDEVHSMSDDSVLEKVLSLIECYGCRYEIRGD